MQTFSKKKQRNASSDSNQFFLLLKIRYSRSCLASVYFNNRQSLKAKRNSNSHFLSAHSLMRICKKNVLPFLLLVYTIFSLATYL